MKTTLIAASVVAMLSLPAMAQNAVGTSSPASTTNKGQGFQGATGQTVQDPAGSSSEMTTQAPRKTKAKHAKKRKHTTPKSSM